MNANVVFMSLIFAVMFGLSMYRWSLEDKDQRKRDRLKSMLRREV